jgi:hypothetical protein
VVPSGVTGGHAWNLNGAVTGPGYAGAATYAALITAFAAKYGGN